METAKQGNCASEVKGLNQDLVSLISTKGGENKRLRHGLEENAQPRKGLKSAIGGEMGGKHRGEAAHREEINSRIDQKKPSLQEAKPGCSPSEVWRMEERSRGQKPEGSTVIQVKTFGCFQR